MSNHSISECPKCGCRGHFELCPNKCHTNGLTTKKYALTWEEYLRLLLSRANSQGD